MLAGDRVLVVDARAGHAGRAATWAACSPCATAPTSTTSAASWTPSGRCSTRCAPRPTSTPTACTRSPACSSSGTSTRRPTTCSELRVDPLGSDDGPVRDPYLRGLLAAKASAAAERGVRPRLSEDSRLPAGVRAARRRHRARQPASTTRSRAAAGGAAGPPGSRSRWPRRADPAPRGDRQRRRPGGRGVRHAFDDGWTTCADDGRPHGLGLALARQTARRGGGEVRLSSRPRAATTARCSPPTSPGVAATRRPAGVGP